VLAFVDYADGKVAVVAAEFLPNGRVSRIVHKPLDVSLLVSQTATGEEPARAVRPTQIRRLPTGGMEVRLSFSNPNLAVDRVDVKSW